MKITVFVALICLFTIFLPAYADNATDYTNPYPAPPASSTPLYGAPPITGAAPESSGVSFMNYSTQYYPEDRSSINNEDLKYDNPQDKGTSYDNQPEQGLKYDNPQDMGTKTDYLQDKGTKTDYLQDKGTKTDYLQEKGTKYNYPPQKGRAVSAYGRVQPLELSPIEKALYGDMSPAQYARPQAFSVDHLQQFGYSFFRTDSNGFAPVTDIPVGPDYIVGVGDKIVLTLWGSINGKYELEVNRNGEITLPKVGTANVAGINYVQLKQVTHDLLAKEFKDFDLDVNIGKLRQIKVYLVGEVKSPGDYNLTSLATVINALSAAGGPSKNGSLRKIQIRRNGKLIETVDLYDFFLKGDKSRDIRLQSGDTVFVPTIGPVVGVAGNVKRPAIYEIRDEKSLKDALKLADGINTGGYLQRVQISRIITHEKKIVSDFNLDPAITGKSPDELTASIPVQDMDMVKVFSIDATLRGSVKLVGFVLRPGNYALKPGMHLKDILGQDNLLPEYYQEIGEITRRSPPDYRPEKIIFNPSRALSGDPAQNFELREFDVVRIFSRWEMEEIPKVRISGEVQKPGEYQLFKNMTVHDLLILAGNPKLTAYMKNADITRIKKTGESVTSFPININLEEAIKDNPQHNIPLMPFDELIVRKIPNWANETERYVVLTGEFRFPGRYPIFKGEKLSSVIERAGGFTDKAYLRATKFTRVSVRELQQKRMDEMIVKAEQEIVKKQAQVASVAASKDELDATKAALEGLQRSIDLLKTVKAEGRLVIHMSNLDKFKDSPYDVEVMGGDILDVPQKPNAVNVLGQVYNPTSIIPTGDADVGFYLAKAGGPTSDAEEDDIYIVRVDGTVQSRQQISFFKGLFSTSFMSTILGPGDTIIVPQRFEKIAWMREIKDLTSILANVALTAGVMVAAGL
jgi:protein involved in polysaccharide export with SLBB domain